VLSVCVLSYLGNKAKANYIEESCENTGCDNSIDESRMNSDKSQVNNDIDIESTDDNGAVFT
jgi:hypothetical protein